MKKEVSPAAFWALIAVVVVVAIGFGYKMLKPGGYNKQTTGSEATMDKFNKTGEFYKPPVSMPAGSTGSMPTTGGGATVPGGMGGYNLQPPSH